jgi:hypothetical protein
MDFQQLNTALNQLGVIPQDVCRASLYFDYLTQAQTYFNTTLAGPAPGGLGGGYPFVEDAVRSANLLQELADILDFYVAPAVDADLQRAYAPPPGGLGHGGGGGWTYRDYFDNVILNVAPGIYAANVAAFMLRYPITDYALQRLFANFRNNIRQACERVIADDALLTQFYEDLYEDDFSILYLKKIKSTGSDFHKGGKQVLILTFRIVHTVDYGPPTGPGPSVEDLKVVYKPSDLEVDCLIIGKAAAINNVVPGGFMNASLVEIYNTRLAAYKLAHPGFTGEELPTYRILPRNYLSAYLGGYPLPIGNAYGYIQYLDNDLSGVARQIFGYYPQGESDYLIFKSQNEHAITQKFYRQEGALIALACTFSFQDLHIENLRVKQYEPYLIDLEICLTKANNGVTDTALIDNFMGNALGGINSYHVDFSDIEWVVGGGAGNADVHSQLKDDYFQNRLWRWQPKRQKSLVTAITNNLLQGCTDGLTVLREEATQPVSAFVAWFLRLNNVLVRYLPYSTTEFRNARREIFINTLLGANPGDPYLATKTAVLLSRISPEYHAYIAPNLPNFLAWQDNESGVDYDNLDIPVFYYRIGNSDLVNSRGQMVAIPANVNINIPPPVHPAVVNLGGRLTFFPNPPMNANVVPQVGVVGGLIGPYNARVLALQNSITVAIGAAAVPLPAVIVPVDH